MWALIIIFPVYYKEQKYFRVKNNLNLLNCLSSLPAPLWAQLCHWRNENSIWHFAQVNQL